MANSLMQIVSDGSLSTIPLTIKFFEQSHIKVFVNNVELPDGSYTFAWSGATTITITPTVAAGVTVSVRRRTPADRVMHDFQAGAVFSELSVDDNFQQDLFLLQEASEQSFVTDLYNDLDMHGFSVRNLRDAQLPKDAVNLRTAEALASSGGTSTLRAELASMGGAGLIGGLPVYVTAVKYAGGADSTVSTNDAAITAAIDAALGTSDFVYWPAVYEVTGTIPNFHKVRHMGPGGIRRGANTLYVDSADTLGKLYASVLGSAGGDGITSDWPMPLNDCMLAVESRLLQNRASRTWVYLADGVYPPLSPDARFDVGAARWFTRLIGTGNATCSIDAGGGATNLMVVRGAGAKLWVEDIHLKGTAGASALASEGATLQLVNCNQTDCYYGLSGNAHAEIYMSGGTHHFTAGFGGYAQVRSIFLCKHYIGYKYDEALGYAVADLAGSCPKFTTDSTQGRGFFAQEGSTGHVRCDLITGYSNGIELVSSSRAHLEDTLSIEKCSRAAEIESGCNIYDAGVNWNTRGVNKNGASIRYLGGVVTNTTQGSVRQRMGFQDITGTVVNTATPTLLGLDFATDGVSNNIGCTYTVTLTGTITGTAGKKDFALQHTSGFCGRVIFPASAQGPFRLEIGFIKTTGDFILPIGLGVAGGFSGDAGVGESGAASAAINRVIDSSPGTLDVAVFVENTADSVSFNAATLHFEG